MIPAFDEEGYLPEGIHTATWSEVERRFASSARRGWLLQGLAAALANLHGAGCRVVYLDGSLVTDKTVPNDYDACWEASGVLPSLLDPVLLDFSEGRTKQKLKYRGELFPSSAVEGALAVSFLEFFQRRQDTGGRKGIIRIELDTLS